MASPSRTSLDSLKVSWASPNRQALLRKSTSSPSGPTTTTISSPRGAAASPPRNRRAHGAQAFQTEFLRTKSLGVSSETKDNTTRFERAQAQVDARVALATSSGLVWVGERDGGVRVLRPDGTVAHQMERKKGVFVWSIVEVRGHVWLGCSDGFVRVVSSQSYEVVRQAGHQGGGAGIHTLLYHSATNTVFSGSNDFNILVWDATSAEVTRQLSGHAAAVRALAATENKLYSGSDDSTIIVWDINTGSNIGRWSGHTKGVHALAISSQGHIFSGGEDAAVRIWNENGDTIASADVHTGPVSALTVTGDKVWAAAGDTVTVWDAIQLKLLGVYPEHHTGYVAAIVPVENSTRYTVWSFGSDGTANLWTTESASAEAHIVRQQAARLSELDHENGRLVSILKEEGHEVGRLSTELERAQAEIDRLGQVESERDALQAEVAELKAQLAASEGRNASLEDKFKSLDLSHHELRGARDKLDETAAEQQFELQRLNGLLQEQHDQRVSTVQQLEHQVAELKQKNANLQRDLTQQTEDGTSAKAEIARLQQQLAAMAQRVSDVEGTLKSRLSLLTDVFGVYRKVEPVHKRAKATVNPTGDATVKLEDVTELWKSFKSVISRHYNDDELAHLRSSRHFFPAESPAKGAGAPAAAAQ